MKFVSLILTTMLFLVGCKATPPVALKNIPTNKSYVENNLVNVDYPGFMAGAGNIYSCRYGIYYKTPEEFTPTREDIFSGLMAKYRPDIENHSVELVQFDVYYNKRLKQLDAASAMGGIAGSIAKETARRGYFGFMERNLLVDSIPSTFPFKTEEVSVGCDDANEGEYFPSRVSGGHDVVVSWFKFKIEERIYHYRTLFQFQPLTNEDIQAGIANAIEESLLKISSQVEI